MALKRCIVFIVFAFLILVCTVAQGAVEQTFAVSEQLWGSWECNEDNEFYLDINFETITYTDKKTGRYIVFPIISQYLEESSSGELYEGILKIGAPAVQTMPVNEINTKLHDNILFWQNYSGLKDPEYGYIFFSRNMDMLLFSEDKNPNDFFILNQEKEIDYLQKYTIRNYYENFVPLALIPVNLNEASDAVFHRISSIAPFKTIFEAWYGKLHEPSLDGCWYEEKAGNEDYYLDIDSTAITYTDVNSGEYVVYPYEQFYEYTSGGYQMTAIKLDPSTSQNIRSEDSFLRMLQSHSETGEYIYYTSTEDNKNMIFCWFAGRQSAFEKYITYTKILTAKDMVLPDISFIYTAEQGKMEKDFKIRFAGKEIFSGELDSALSNEEKADFIIEKIKTCFMEK
ncbi:MAG: hypothetical protein J6T84_01975 [Spirochaetaceae bacterium]|nr:hypothetical protein [Spirochaetaceae bacterium]